MAGSPAANRTQVVFAAADVAVDTAGDTEVEDLDIFASAFRIHRIFYHVEAAITDAAAEMTLTWRPTPGSATDERVVAIWDQPVEAIDAVGVVELNANDDTGTVEVAGSPTGGTSGGIAGSRVFLGELTEDMIFGPGGSLEFNSDGGATAGDVNYYLEVELFSTHGNNQQDSLTVITPTQVGPA